MKLFKVAVFLIIIFFSACSKKSNHKLANSYYKLCLLELEQKEQTIKTYKKSLDYIDKALDQDENPEYLALKATLLFKIGLHEESDAVFKQALFLAPDPKVKSEIMNNQACLLADSGIELKDNNKIDQACSIWKSLEQDKDYLTPEVSLMNLSKVYLTQNKFDLAKENLLKIIQIAPNYLDAHYFLALTSYKLNDQTLAQKELNTVLFLEPDHEGAKNLKIMLKTE